MHQIDKFWNQKFTEIENLYGLEANGFVKTSSKILEKKSKILCLAEGEGRNALYLATKGHEISVIDISQVAIENMENLLSTYGYDVNAKQIDILRWQPIYQEYDAIITTYLHLANQEQFHNVLDKSILSLKTNGYFIGEFFEKKQIDFTSGGPKNIDMLYCINELREYLSNHNITIKILSNETVNLDEGLGHQGKASVIRVIFQKN